MQKFQIVSVGTAVRDVVFYTDECDLIRNPKKDPTRLKLLAFEYGAKLKSEEVYFTFGGGAANTAANFAGLGLRTGVMAGIGADMDGQEIRKNFQHRHVNPSLLKVDKKIRTGLSYLLVETKSNEHVVFVYYGANLHFQVASSDLAKFKADWFYVSSLANKTWTPTMKNLCRTGAKIAWNPGTTQLRSGFKKMANLLPDIEVLILNKDEATELVLSRNKKQNNFSVNYLLREIYSWGPGMVVITDGRSGAWVYDGQKIYQHKPTHGKPKDTTGAGDCFGSTFIAGLIRTRGDIMKSMKLATANVSSLVFHPGAQNGLLPWAKLVKKVK